MLTTHSVASGASDRLSTNNAFFCFIAGTDKPVLHGLCVIPFSIRPARDIRSPLNLGCRANFSLRRRLEVINEYCVHVSAAIGIILIPLALEAYIDLREVCGLCILNERIQEAVDEVLLVFLLVEALEK